MRFRSKTKSSVIRKFRKSTLADCPTAVKLRFDENQVVQNPQTSFNGERLDKEK